MPSGRTHAAISILGSLALYYKIDPSLQLAQPDPTALAIAVGCLAGIIITPDLDVDQPIRSHYLIARKSWALAVVYRLFWWPYAKAIGHRSPLSHWPLIGTAGRLLYMALVNWIILAAVQQDPWPWPELVSRLPWWPWAVTGLAVSDGLHWLADVSWSGFKGKIRGRRKL